MKQKVFPFILAILLLMTLLPGCTMATSLDRAEDRIDHTFDRVEDSIENQLQTTPGSSGSGAADIGIEKAEEIALQHSGLSRGQVQRLHTEYEIDDRTPQYDVQFYVDRTEYEYEIHAETGEILSYDRDS